MNKKIEISMIRVEQFNKMAGLLRDIRLYDVRKQVAELKRNGNTREQALDVVIGVLQGIARESRGISELHATQQSSSQ